MGSKAALEAARHLLLDKGGLRLPLLLAAAANLDFYASDRHSVAGSATSRRPASLQQASPAQCYSGAPWAFVACMTRRSFDCNAFPKFAPTVVGVSHVLLRERAGLKQEPRPLMAT